MLYNTLHQSLKNRDLLNLTNMVGKQSFDISVVVPVYNGGLKLQDCIRSLLESEFDGKFEVIVVDDGSTDESIEHIRDLPVTILRQENKGAAGARNAGARTARSDNLVFVDSDVVVQVDTLQKIYEHLQGDDVNYVGVLYSLEPRNGRWIHQYKALWNYFYDYQFPFSSAESKSKIRGTFLSGGAEAYKRKTFESLGGYNEGIKGVGVEREWLFNMLVKRFPKDSIISDPSIMTQHHFPDFFPILRNSFVRTSELMRLIRNESYRQPFVRRNFVRVASSSFTTLSLIGALVLSIVFQSSLPFLIPLVGFLAFLTLHKPMFTHAFYEKGSVFTFFAIAVALVHISVISLGSIDGFFRSLGVRG